MTSFQYEDAAHGVRPDIAAAHRKYWDALARPGTWWTGAERIAIALETRNARICEFCAERKQALSPYGLEGEHLSSGGLPPIAVDAVHRVVTDQTRITQSYVDRNVTEGLSKEAYVELVGVAVAVFSIDEFHRALGLPFEPLPDPVAGEASGYRPQHLAEDIGFVPTVSPDGAVGNESDLWPPGLAPNILRALSLVPSALREWRDIAWAQYIPLDQAATFFSDDVRSINRVQIELVAGRVSTANECFY